LSLPSFVPRLEPLLVQYKQVLLPELDVERTAEQRDYLAAR
jgi:hypothetical protein